MAFVQAVQAGLRNYVQFQGRARRSEFWWWVLFQIGALIVAEILDSALGHIGLLYALVALGLFLPGLAIQIRRLHDTGRSGWWLLLALVPIVGGLILIWWWCQDGELGLNRFGVDPKGRDTLSGAAPPMTATV